MLFIDKNSENVTVAITEHLNYTRCLIWKKLGSGKKCTNSCPICESKIESINNIPPNLYKLLLEDGFIELVLTGSPSELLTCNEKFLRKLLTDDIYEKIFIDSKTANESENESLKKYYEIITKIFDYDTWFIKNEPSSYYSAYHMAIYLDIRSCVYCNRSYTITDFKKDPNGKLGKLLRPQFDHWFPKEKYPLLSLSFYNLIPCCHICNSSVKGRKVFDLDTHLHPYIDDLTDSFIFGYDQLPNNNVSIEIIACDNDSNIESKINKTIKDFYLTEMYNGHHSELKDLISIKKAYSEKYLSTLKNAFPNVDLSSQEIYRMAFGVELDKKDFHKRPFSKFKSDILKELGII